ncbi:DUF1127 domain-containing protein [Amaricoccus sp.]|uniref:DUF1127 domain-containing protein n=1 Tax=Amaricoccus sp. TaxID=1872485 RepID=UPI001B6544FB|nr:DUF1127 domain-containing protein [Amaricoccus sp.]MBP7003244.1 DUF1127 domain-containing protein [Amaricoccus sp.]
MTTAYAPTHGRSRASALEAGLDTVLDRVRTAWNQHRAYRRTLAELRGLSPRTLRDLGLDTADLGEVARREAYAR